MSFWIKRDKSLTSKPEVLQIASTLNIDRWSAAGRCEDVWSWADEHTENGHAPGVTKVFIDQLVACDGFADAMQKVGWLEITASGLTIPKFERHNGKSAKKRVLDAERQRNAREQSRKESRKDRDKNHDRSVTPSDSDSVSVSVNSSLSGGNAKGGDDRTRAFEALSIAVGRSVSTSDDYKLTQYHAGLPDTVTIHGGEVDSWALIARALTEAAVHGSCQNASGAIKYVQAVCARCIQHECWPGEFIDEKPKPVSTMTAEEMEAKGML